MASVTQWEMMRLKGFAASLAAEDKKDWNDLSQEEKVQYVIKAKQKRSNN